jgi:hypothetical protein
LARCDELFLNSMGEFEEEMYVFRILVGTALAAVREDE